MTLDLAAPAAAKDSSELARRVGQLAERLEAGEQVDLDAFCADCPELREPLAALLPTLQAVVELDATLGRPAAPASAGRNAAAEDSGRRLGDFRILRELGRGGMGVVYEAEQLSLGRRVALKVLPYAAMLDKQQLARFKNEARAAATLDHPNIVQVHSVGVERGVHYYAMHLVEGESLAQVIARLRQERGGKNAELGMRSAELEATAPHRPAGNAPPAPSPSDHSAFRIPTSALETHPVAALSTQHAPHSSLLASSSREYFRTIARLGIQAAEALDHAHQNGILHRDVKPANLLVDDAGKLWVTDFGLARLEADAGMTMTGDLIGTLRYMSPEQALAKRVVVDHRSDVYSLGVTLYELLTLEPVYQADDRHELFRQIAFAEPIRLRQHDGQIPQDLETIVLKAIERSPAQRYATAQELACDLRSFLAHEPIKAKPATWRGRLIKWSRRHPAGVRATLLAILMSGIVLAASIGWAARDRQAKQALAEATSRFAITGMDLYRMGRLDEAIVACQEAIRLNPDFAEAYYTLGLALNDQGNIEQALSSFREAIRLMPDFAEAHYKLANSLHLMGRIDQAVASYREAIRLNPNLGNAHNDLAVLFSNDGKIDEAIAQYRGAIKAAPNNYSLHYNLGLTLISRDRSDFDEGISHIRESVRLNPYYAMGYIRLGRLYRSRALDEAITYFSHSIRLDLSTADEQNAYFELEEMLGSTQGIGAVSAFYREMILIQPAHPTFHLRLAKTLRMQGEKEQAVAAENEAHRLRGLGFGHPRAFGDYYADSGRYAQAAPWYREAQRETPHDPAIAVRLAFLLLLSGDRAGHEAQCREMLARFAATSDPDSLRQAAWACCLSNPPVGDMDELVRLGDLFQNKGNLAPALRENALVAYRAGNWEKALTWCVEGQKWTDDVPERLRPHRRFDYRAHFNFIEAMAQFQLGEVKVAQATLADAISDMEQAYPSDPSTPRGRTEWVDFAYCTMLRREAEALMNQSGARKAAANSRAQSTAGQ